MSALRVIDDDRRHRQPRDPSLAHIALAWMALPAGPLEATFPLHRSLWIGWGEPFCFACGWLADVEDASLKPRAWRRERRIAAVWNSAAGQLERAHLHDYSAGGSCKPLNYAPLCPSCHRLQPICGTRQDGIDFVNHVARAVA